MPEVELSPAVATWLLRLGLRAAQERVRNGAWLRPEERETLERLAMIADAELDGEAIGSATRTASGSVVDGSWVTVRTASDLVGKSSSYIQRLARKHQVRHRRVGARTYEIEMTSLRGFLERTNHHA